MRIRAPANVHLLRAQVILILGALIPTILTTPLGVILLVSGESEGLEIVTGVLVLAFAASSVTGFIIGGIFLRRGSALVTVQHDFLSSVSHELRTPMTSMRMFVEALLDDRLTDPDERAKCLRVLAQEIDRLDGLVGKLIELSRLETDRDPYERIPLRLADVIQESLGAFDAIQAFDKTFVHVEIGERRGANAGENTPAPLPEPAPDDLIVMGDRSALVQVVVNLLSNAWKYSGADKEIHCMARAAGEKEVELVVTDDGPGIPAEEQKQIFEKFWRGKAAVEGGSAGSGLGLAVVWGIVKAHRGRIELRSPADASTGTGTAFHVFLPRGTSAEPSRAKP